MSSATAAFGVRLHCARDAPPVHLEYVARNRTLRVLGIAEQHRVYLSTPRIDDTAAAAASPAAGAGTGTGEASSSTGASTQTQTLGRSHAHRPFPRSMRLHLFLDRSLLELFVNGGRQTVSAVLDDEVLAPLDRLTERNRRRAAAVAEALAAGASADAAAAAGAQAEAKADAEAKSSDDSAEVDGTDKASSSSQQAPGVEIYVLQPDLRVRVKQLQLHYLASIWGDKAAKTN